MLESTMTKDPTAIEVLFCEPFSKLPVREMTKDEMDIFIRLTMIEKDGRDGLIPENEDDIPFSIKMLRSSLNNRFTFEMTEPLQLMVADIAGSVGGIIMFLTYLQYRAKKLNKKKLNIEDFANIFPMGFPIDKALHDIWDSQKVKRSEENVNGSDNLLDYQTALQSIHFSKEEA